MPGLPTAGEIRNAGVAPVASRYPYDRDSMSRTVEVVATDGTTFKQRRDVAQFIDQARERACDYYHPGGTIYDSHGKAEGSRKAGWFLAGYKWADDPDSVMHVATGG